ncbi:very short patch repair endonuclease [Sulfurospirillum sp. MES]|uniref:very short patch repair endonuclease n=1 Tax=Sulfurospirillum sp. MES TaxID=1565314 RepID=UPI000541C779|nr:very short patch repair endonuclease [Sulfurospirillum sp. MES]KHG34887.1 MAG: hypothetical protein OA34_01635 [Sulfurospirillum sp. MES]
MDSKTAKKIKSKNTGIELLLRRELWKRGYRYRVNDRTVFGKPDIVFHKQKIAIFCDSEFWHGKKFLAGEQFKTNNEFWEAKIKRNIERDQEVNRILETEGWKVLRFWGIDIKNNVTQCINIIEERSIL